MRKIQFKQVGIKDWKLVEKIEKGAASAFFCPCDGEEGYKKYEKRVVFKMTFMGHARGWPLLIQIPTLTRCFHSGYCYNRSIFKTKKYEKPF